MTSHTHIPADLKALPQWVGWKTELRDGKKSKIPKTATTGWNASSTNQKTWCDYNTVVSAVEKLNLDGPGFVFSDKDPYSGVDLDDCRDPDSGEIAPWAWKIIHRLNSYSEISPSQTGVKVWVIAKLPGSGKKKPYESGEVEVYSRERYFAVTGLHLEGTPKTIESRQAELEALVSEIFGTSESSERSVDTGIYRNWDALNGELRCRIAAHPTHALRPDGAIHTQAICHNGKSKGLNGGLVVFPSGAIKCTKGCEHEVILRAFGLPERPNGNGHAKNEAPFPEEEPRIASREPGEDDEECDAGVPDENELDSWPQIQPAAFHGLAGEIVALLEPHTEADPVALLIQLLIMFGNVVDRQPHFKVGAARHGFNLYGVLVGDTSSGRKGTSLSDLKPFFRTAELFWTKNCQSTGLSTGEGLIWAFRDPIYELKTVKEKGKPDRQEEVLTDRGVENKRLLVLETEFSRVLAVMGRESNTLSAVLRQAWDGDDLKLLTKNSSAKCTEPHLSIIGHITRQELRRQLSATDGHNGFANRFLWVCVRRSRYLPDGGHLPDQDIDPYAERLAARAATAKHVGLMVRSQEARVLWEAIYRELSEGQPGLFGAVTSRAVPQTMRLACLYALLDGTSVVEKKHLEAAFTLWRYCEDSARFIFGAATGNAIADRIFTTLRKNENGITRGEISAIFKRNVTSEKIQAALNLLLRLKLAKMVMEKAATGRPTERWLRF